MKAVLRVLAIDATPAMGGAERALLAFAERLNVDRLEMELACPLGGELEHGFRQAGLAVHAFDARELRATRPLALPRALHRFRVLLDERQPDVVLLNGLRALKTCLALGGKHPPVVAFVHDILGPATSTRALRLFGYFRNRVEHWVTPCEAATESLVRVAGIEPGRVHTIPPACEPHGPLALGERRALRRSCGLDPDRVLIGYVGQLEPRKAPELFLDAAARMPSVAAVLVGDDPFGEHGAYRQALMARARELPGVRVLGWRCDAARLVAALDVVVCASRADACPLVVLEALAAGVPVVATRVGGIPEQLGADEAGLLVPPGDVPALATAIERLVEDGALRARLGSAGRARFEARFTPVDASRRLGELLLAAV